MEATQQQQVGYTRRPAFKNKFKPSEAKTIIEKLIPTLVKQHQERPNRQAAEQRRGDDDDDEEDNAAQQENWKDVLARQISAKAKEALTAPRKDREV